MASEIITTTQALTVTQVGGCTLTAIEQEPETGFYVREMRIYKLGEDGKAGPIILSVRVTSATRSGVEMKTPELTF